MRFNKRTGLLVFLSVVATVCFGQKSLLIGEQIPDIITHNIKNYESPQLEIRSFQGKLVILDFWSVGCKGCIAAFPKMQALQDYFKNHIQIILVTRDSRSAVDRLFSRNGMDKSIHLPIITDDTAFHEIFSFRTVPTHAWIARDGSLAYFTNGEGTNAKNISKYLAGQDIKLPLKLEYRDFDTKISLLKEGNGRNLKLLKSHSALFHRIFDDGVSGIVTIQDESTKEKSGLRAINLPLARLYKIAWQEQLTNGNVYTGRENYGNLIIESTKHQFYFNSQSEVSRARWSNENTYCYEIEAEPSMFVALKEKMQQDLDFYFGLESYIEKRKVSCYILQQQGNRELLLSKSAQYEPRITGSKKRIKLKKQAFRNLLFEIDALFCSQNGDFLPLVNNTEFSPSDLIELDIKGELTDIEIFRTALSAYGLDLVKDVREINVLVISDRE